MNYLEDIKCFVRNNRGLVIAIDGPAGTGKSTLARKLAENLSINFISMGNMFRLVATELIRREISYSNTDEVIKLINESQFEFENGQFYMNGDNRINEKTEIFDYITSYIASKQEIHKLVSKVLRTIVKNHNIVIDGRAAGSCVFPEATVKFFLDANLDVRADRRFIESKDELSHNKLKEKMVERDLRDSNREYAPLLCTAQHIFIDSTNKSIDDVYNQVLRYIYYSLILTNLNDDNVISQKIVNTISSDSRSDLDSFEKVDLLYYLMSNIYSEKSTFKSAYCSEIKDISLEMLNQLLVTLCLDSSKRDVLLYSVHVIPEISENAAKKGFENYEKLCNTPLDCNHVNEVLEIVEKCIANRDLQGSYTLSQFHKNEMLVLIKPDATKDIAIIKSIIERIFCYGYSISRIQVHDAAYYKIHKEKIISLYKEAYEGYCRVSFSNEFYLNIKKIYDTNLFKFLFDECYDQKMVVSANTLIEAEGVSEEVIAEIWDQNRRNVNINDFVEKYAIDSFEQIDNDLQLCKGNRKVILNNLKIHDNQITTFHSGECYGINKPIRSHSTLAVRDKRIRNGKPTIIVNGHVQGLIDIFTKPDSNLIISMIISGEQNSSSWNIMRQCFSGDNSNPDKCLPGSIRKNAWENNLLKRSMNITINGLRNVVHLSNGPLEALSEINGFFDIPIDKIPFGKLLIDKGYDLDQIKSMLNNPLCSHNKGLFELTAKLEFDEALEVIDKEFKKK